MKKAISLLCLVAVCCICFFSCTPTGTKLIGMPTDRAAMWYSSGYEPQGLFFESAEDMLTVIRTKNYEELLIDSEYIRAIEDAAYMHMIATIWGNGRVYYADEPEATYMLLPMRNRLSPMSNSSSIQIISQFNRDSGKLRMRTAFILKDALAVNQYNQKDGQLIESINQNGAECTYLFYGDDPTVVHSGNSTYFLVKDWGWYILEFKVVSTEQQLTSEQVIDLFHSVNIQSVDLWDEIRPY